MRGARSRESQARAKASACLTRRGARAGITCAARARWETGAWSAQACRATRRCCAGAPACPAPRCRAAAAPGALPTSRRARRRRRRCRPQTAAAPAQASSGPVCMQYLSGQGCDEDGRLVAWWRGRALVSRARRCSRRCTVGAGVTCRRCQCKCKRAPPPGAGSAARALRGGSGRHLQVRARPLRRERGRHAGADELVVQRRADQDDRKAEHLPAPGASVSPMQLDGTSLALGCRPADGTAYRGEPEPYAGQGT